MTNQQSANGKSSTLTQSYIFAASDSRDKDKWLSPLLDIIGKSVVSLDGKPWYYPKFTREKAEAKLESKPVGTFLIRPSSKGPGNFALSVKEERKIEHLLINQTVTGAMSCYFPALRRTIVAQTVDELIVDSKKYLKHALKRKSASSSS